MNYRTNVPLEALEMYQQGMETGRLSDGHNQLELLRVRELMTRFLPASPAVVLDVGGGPGAHSLWLA